MIRGKLKSDFEINFTTKNQIHQINVSDSISMSLNKKEVSVSSTKQTYVNRDLELPEKYNLEPIKELRQSRQKNFNQLIFAQLNMNAIKNKFDSLVELVKEVVDILLISETKTDSYSTVSY